MEEREEIIILDEKSLKDKIYMIRGQQVMLDFDLAKIYGYTVSAFNQQVKRNIERFPADFMFQLEPNEFTQCSKSQNVILNIDTVPNAQQYIFDVYENNMFCQGGFTKENTITLIADFLPFHGMIRIEVKASGEGYKDSEPSILNIQIGNEITIPILKNLQTFVMPRSLIHVEEQGFEGVGAERIILQDSIKTINSCSFANCKNLQYINLPDSLTYIASDAFEGCDNLFIECSAGSLGEEFARAHGFYPVLK